MAGSEQPPIHARHFLTRLLCVAQLAPGDALEGGDEGSRRGRGLAQHRKRLRLLHAHRVEGMNQHPYRVEHMGR